MKEKIITLLKEESCNYKTIKRKIQEKNEEKLKQVLKEMELAGEIFLTVEGLYTIFPKNFKIGTVQFTKARDAFILYQDGISQFIKRENLHGAFNYDTVVVNIDTANIEKILFREFSKIVCEVRVKDGIKYLKPCNVIGNVRIRIDSNNMKKLQEHDRIVVDVSLETTDDYFEGVFINKVRNINEPDLELKTIAISNGFQTEFNEECLNQVKEIPQFVKAEDIKDRVDLREEEIFTIDGIKTKDMDDAVSLEKLENGNYLLGVHIADVSHYIKEGTPLYEEAKDRGTSLYMANSVIPMLPPEISNGICSLNPHVDRLTISCMMEIDETGEIKDYHIFKSVINSKMKMNYDDVNKVLNQETIPISYQPFQERLLLMQELSQILTDKKEKRGYLHFASTETDIIEKETKILNIVKKDPGKAEDLIANFMIMANACIATHLGWIGFIPSIYRNHGNPNFDKVNATVDFIENLGYRIQTIKNSNNALMLQKVLEQLSNKEEFPVLSTLILKSMQRAEYNTKNIGHFALKLPFYTHFTSPIRRFPDLEVHQILKKLVSKDLEYMDFNEMQRNLQDICHHASYKERQADNAEEEAEKLKMTEYMQAHIGEEFYGFVTNIEPKYILVQTIEGIPGIIYYESSNPTYKFDEENRCIRNANKEPILKIGHHLLLKAKSTNIENRITIFQLKQNITLEDKMQKQKRLTKQIS